MRAAPRLAACLLLGTLPAARAQTLDGASPFSYRVDIRPAAGTDDHLGVDFDLRYDRTRDSRNPQGHHYGFAVSASGFQSFDRDIDDVNSVVGELTLQGRYYSSALRPLPPEQQARYRDLLERDDAGAEGDARARGPGLTPTERQELNRLFDLLGRNRQFFTYDLHYRFESSQDFADNQHAFGAGGGAEVPALHRLFDILPALTRRRGAFRPQPVRVYLGIDRVTGAQETEPGRAGGQGGFWRLRGSAAWSTLVFDDLTLRARAQGFVLLDAPAAVKARDMDVTGLVEAWLLYPLAGEASLMIKYLAGRLPPNYDEINAGKVGLSIALQ